MLGLSEAGLIALVGAVTSGIAALLAGMAALISKFNRSEIRAPDRNGLSMRDEVIQIERMLAEHIRQTEEAITRIGRTRDEVVEWLRQQMGKDEG